MAFIGQTSLRDTAAANTRILDVTCDPTVFIGAAVRMTSGGIAVNALADSLENSNVIGVVEEKSTSTKCTIRFLGLTIDAIFSGLDVTKEYFLSDTTAGALTTNPPTASGHIIFKIGQPFSATQFLVNKGTRIQRA